MGRKEEVRKDEMARTITDRDGREKERAGSEREKPEREGKNWDWVRGKENKKEVWKKL